MRNRGEGNNIKCKLNIYKQEERGKERSKSVIARCRQIDITLSILACNLQVAINAFYYLIYEIYIHYISV